MKMPGKNGFTLVEVLVSAALISIALVAVVAVVRAGTGLNAIDDHRRQARTIISTKFESPAYSYMNFVNLSETPSIPDETVTINSHGPLTGTLHIVISPLKTYPTGSVNYREISMTVYWPEQAGLDSLTLTKWLTQVQ